jgi:putrescine transport system ATP-binding protein
MVLNGQDLSGIPPFKSPMSMMFQSYALFPHMTVWDNVAFGPRRSGLSPAEVAARVEEMLKLVQLTEFANYRAQAAPTVRRAAAARGIGSQFGQEI